MRVLNRARAIGRLLGRYGPIGTARITRSVASGRPITFTNRGNAYTMPPGKSAVYHLLESVDKLRRLAEFVRPNDRIIVDVGAHAGLFSAFALERAPEASALLVEPDPALVSVIEHNLVGKKWRVVVAAAAEASGRATFYRSESSQESSLVEGMIQNRHDPMTVDTVTLDQLCEGLDHVDVMKIDVQGAELATIHGGRKTLAKVRTLLIEVTLLDPNAHRVLDELVSAFGAWTPIQQVHLGADLLFERTAPRGSARRS